MRTPELVRVGTPRLPKSPGTNRFYWDLTAPGPWSATTSQSGRFGPTIVPGAYVVRLTAGAWRAEVPLQVKADPRALQDGVSVAVMREQFEHNVRARDLVTEVNQLVARVEQARSRLANASGAAADTLSRIEELRRALVTPSVRYSKPELQDHIRYLYSMTVGADQKIGRDAIERLRQLRLELDQRQREAKALIPENKVM
jgi:hypothetical protein